MQKNWLLLIAIKFKKVTYTWARTEHAILNREGRRYTWLRFSVFYIFFKMILIHVQFERSALSIYKQLFIFLCSNIKKLHSLNESCTLKFKMLLQSQKVICYWHVQKGFGTRQPVWNPKYYSELRKKKKVTSNFNEFSITMCNIIDNYLIITFSLSKQPLPTRPIRV